jgi:hypothetical protein
MTPEKLADLKGMAEMFGEEGFNEFLARMRGGAQGEGRLEDWKVGVRPR